MSGTEMQRAKEGAAEIMRQKQAAGTISVHVELCDFAKSHTNILRLFFV